MTQLHHIDYTAVGLKCGIEIHQQLEGRKLFCDSPTIIRDDAAHFTVRRSIRAVVGETGVIDAAAAAEMNKGLVYQYHGYNDTIGLVELDEEPPHSINRDALATTLQMAKFLNANVVDEIQVMRKTVVDGSNTSGFQRTALVGQNGFLTTSTGKRIDVPTVILEEDACKKVSDKEKDGTVIYNLSRLGIPLIEVSTDPQLSSAKEVAEVAEKFGLMLRSLPGVKRGLGTIRQDLNVSVKNGNRVEIKGAQDLRMLEQYVDFEIVRQLNILQLHSDLVNIGFSAQMIVGADEVDVSACFKDTACELISKSLKTGKVVMGIKVPKLCGIIGRELQPNKRLGTELSDFAKVHAGIGGLIHSDEKIEKYNIGAAEVSAVKSMLKLEESDAYILVVDLKGRCHEAFNAIRSRLSQLSTTMPKEVRRANPDATSTYMRPMPGQARMYPETDVLPIVVDFDVIVPEQIEQKIERYVSKYGLAADRAKMIAKSDKSKLFEEFFDAYPNVKPSAIVETVIGSTLKDVEKKTGIALTLSSDDFHALFSAWNNGLVNGSSVSLVLCEMATGKKNVNDAIKQFIPLSDEELRKIIVTVVASNPGQAIGALTGKVMVLVKGKADGKRVGELLKAAL